MFARVYKDLVDRWHHWRSDDRGLGLEARAGMDETDPEIAVMLKAARRATWDALHGPRHLRSGRFRPVIDDAAKPDALPQNFASRTPRRG